MVSQQMRERPVPSAQMSLVTRELGTRNRVAEEDQNGALVCRVVCPGTRLRAPGRLPPPSLLAP